MTLAVIYPNKAALKAAIGQQLQYEETSMFGAEWRADGVLTVAGRPHLHPGRVKREFFARVTMRAGLVAKVE